MSPGSAVGYRELSPAVRFGMLVPLVVGAAYVTLVLLLAPSHTGLLFAWTMDPATATLLGGAYAGSCAMLWLAATRADSWVRARVTVLSSSLFMLLELAATLLGHRTLHLRGGELTGVLAAWGWLGVHLVAPLIGVVALGFQHFATAGAEPPLPEPLPWWVGGPTLAAGAFLGLLGAVLFADPGPAARGWPWPVSQLDVRMLATWSLCFGVAMVMAHRERDLRRVRHGMAALLLTGVLGLVGLVRQAGQVHWGSVGTWCVVAVLMLLLGMGLSGLGLAALLPPPPPLPRPGPVAN